MTSTTMSTSVSPVDGTGLPAGTTWEIDPGHTDVAFVAGTS
jgi:hypothetical protein